MNSKTLRRQRELKQKLMAAISMLLVSSLMMVTSTYAWFTLSTAPEVTGITTAIGANGNLEMALLNPTLQENNNGALISSWGDAIGSGTQDSMDAAGKLTKDANITWGNLVDLSDPNTYGLHNINLYPSQLKTTVEGGNTIAANPLARPVFGADGRIAELKADTLTASYASNTFSNEGALGVRAVGTSSSMTARELAHRAAFSSASTATSQAKTAASTALNTNGNVLAAMAIQHVGNEDTFTRAQVETLKSVIEALATSHTHIENAMNWYIVAHNIAPEDVNDSTYLTIQEGIRSKDLATIKADSTIRIPSNFDDVYEKLTESKQKVSNALTTLNEKLATNSSTYGWNDFSTALSAVMDYNNMKLNGVEMSKLTETNDKGEYVNLGAITSNMGNGLELQMPTGTGVFADIADFCGTYTASIVIPDGTSVMNIPIGGMKAAMATNAPVNPTYLERMRSGTDTFEATEGGEATKSITDFYGYIVDLAFRTNAADSNLLLQADATDRIYGEEGSNEDTMGGGSSMTFEASDAFGVTRVEALMNHLRIVFFDTNTNEIIGEARLNAKTVEIEGNAVTMKMAMWDKTATPQAAFKTGDGANVITALNQNEAKAISVLVYLDGTAVKNADVATSGSSSMTGTMNLQFASDAQLKPMEYTDLKDGQSSDEADQTIKMTKVDVDAAAKAKGYSVVTAIGTNSTTGTNGFGVILNNVPANSNVTAKIGEGSPITGTYKVVSGMNGYYFETTETLAADTVVTITVVESGGSGTQTPATTYDVTVPTGVTGAATATANTDYTFTVDTANYTLGTVTVGDSTVEPTAGENGSYTIPAASVTGNIVITVTANNG